MFNTLRYAKKLEEAGVSREQAEAQVQIFAEIVEDDVATKVDVQNIKSDLHGDVTGLRSDVKSEVNNLRADFSNLKIELKNDMALLEHRIVIRLGTIVTVAIAAATAVIKLF